ncbi:rhomboid-like protein [Streptomyces sp. HPF1205]|uniref:rhomboid-like protein n=1 Tax=Streptomyces sp. HPF1205 TaxID=2873262 RepID=UPI001CEC0B01|nr:rhomboid-like protein [Streptomyces sp. HPF1205]
MAPQIPETSEPPSPQDRAGPPLALRRGRATSVAGRRGPCAGPAARRARQWVRSTPGTHIWLGILAVTTVVVAVSSPALRSYLLHSVSTNLVELRHHPIRVLIGSALWIETPSGFVFYVALFELVHATAERWLGTWRWLLVVAVAHVGATLISQKAVRLGIRDQRLPHSLAHTVDIGVSYGLAGVIGVLTYRVPRPWRWGYLTAVLAYGGYQVANDGTFTDLGHLTAVLLGLGCWVLTPPGRTREGEREPGWERRPGREGRLERERERERGRGGRPVIRRGRRDVPAPPRCRPRRWRR